MVQKGKTLLVKIVMHKCWNTLLTIFRIRAETLCSK